MLLPPPGLLTTVIGTLTSLLSTSARSTERAVLSLLPPGAEPTTISTLRWGDQLAAWAERPMATNAVSASTRCNLMLLPSLRCECGPQCVGAAFLDEAAQCGGPGRFVAVFLAPRPQAQGDMVQRIFRGHTDRAVHLVRDQRALARRFGSADFRGCDRQSHVAFAFQHAGRRQRGGDGGGYFAGEAREFLLDRLELTDTAAELHAFPRVAHGEVQRA